MVPGAERALAGDRREVQSPELGHRWRFFWSAGLSHTTGLSTSDRADHVHEHSGMDWMDLRPHRELLLVSAPPGHHLWPVGLRVLAPASAYCTGPTPIAARAPLEKVFTDA